MRVDGVDVDEGRVGGRGQGEQGDGRTCEEVTVRKSEQLC